MELKKHWNRLLGLSIFIIILYWSINNLNLLKEIFKTLLAATNPFIGGIVLAFILNLLVVVIEKYLLRISRKRKKWHRVFSTTVSFFVFVLVLLLLIFLVIPDLQLTITSFVNYVPSKINDLIEYSDQLIKEYPEIIKFVEVVDLDLNSIQTEFINFLQKSTASIITGTFDFVMTTLSSLIKVFIAIIFAFYLLMIKETLIKQIKKIIYSIFSLPWANYIVNVGKEANRIFSSFMGGQLIEGFILGFLVYLGMWIFKFPYRLSISVITGAMVFIPVYGALLGGFLGFILISVVNFPKAIGFAVYIIVLQQIESNLIYPRVVGNSIGLPGIWVLFAVTVGGSLFGLIGIILGVPITSLAYSLISAQVNYKLQQKELVIETNSRDL